MIGFYDEVVRRVGVLPGVKAAAVASALPMDVSRMTPVLVEGQPAVPLAERPIIIIQTFTSSYLRAMEIPLIKGRFFNPYDKQDSLRVLAVNQSFARRFFPGQDPIGKHIWLGRMTIPSQIVGVIGDVKNVSLSSEPQPEIDAPFAQLPWARMHLILRASGTVKSLTDAVRIQVAGIDRDQPVTAVETGSELLSEGSSQTRLIMMLLTGFAAFAFVLAMLGLYGVISYSVAQRTQEMGVRIALGATRADLLKLVLRQGAVLAGFGIAIGIASSLALTRLMTAVLYGISSSDPLTFSIAPVVFFVFALLASYGPAIRATRVDVIEALRG